MKTVIDLVGFESERSEELSFQAVGLSLGENSDDGIRLIVQSNGLADDVAVAAEALHPKLMGHDGNAVFPHNSFLGEDIPPEHKGSAHHVVETRSRQAGPNHFGMVARGQAVAAAGPSAQILKNGALVFPIEEIPRGNAVAAAVDLRPDDDELVRIGVRQGSEKGGVDDAEDGGVRADAQHECQERDAREAEIFGEQSQAKTDVPCKVRHAAPPKYTSEPPVGEIRRVNGQVVTVRDAELPRRAATAAWQSAICERGKDR